MSSLLKTSIVTLVISLYQWSFGQIQDSLNQEYLLVELIESVVDENNNGTNFQDILDQYNYLVEFPISLNTATKKELQQVPFFTPQQIASIIYHRNIYGHFVDKKELLFLGFHPSQLLFISPIISLTKINQPYKLLQNLSHQILFRHSAIINNKEGFSNGKYLGDRNKLYTRYKVQNRRFGLGFTLEKDEGEALLNNSPYSTHNGFDFMSGHIRIAPKKLLNEIIIGDYSLNFGQGTVLWNGFSTGKSALSQNIEKVNFSTRPYTSVNESSFLRGAIAKLSVKSFDLFLFSSRRKLDANITEIDSINNSPTKFSSFQTSGFHRTKSELEDRKKVTQILNGYRLVYSNNKLSIATTLASFQFDTPISRGEKLYQQYNFEGKQLINSSIDFGYNFKKSRLFGDIAFSSNNGKTGIIGCQWRPSSSLSHVSSIRVLSKEYFSPYANIFNESGRTNNEIGFYNGFEWHFNQQFSSTFYADYYQYKQPTYSSITPTKGQDYLIQLNYRPNDKTEVYLRYKHEQKTDDTSPDYKFNTSTLKTLNRLRFHITHSPHYKISFKTRTEIFWGNKENKPENGFLIYQDLKYLHKKLTFTGRLAHFNTSSFSSAIYAYENDVLYSFSVPAYYYQGAKFYLLVKYKINKHLALWTKYSEMIFDNKDSIGSGSEQIDGNKKQNIKFQLEWKF